MTRRPAYAIVGVMGKQTIDINIEIKGLDFEANAVLDMLKAMRGVPKWQIVREALTEYANQHKADILMKMTKGKKKNV